MLTDTFTADESACYRLGCCDVLVNRVDKPKCEEMSQQMSPMLRTRDIFFGQLSTLKSNIFSTRKLRMFLTDIVMNFHDWRCQSGT